MKQRNRKDNSSTFRKIIHLLSPNSQGIACLGTPKRETIPFVAET